CGEGQQPREFIPAPTTQPPGSLDPRFSNWQVSNGSYGGIEPARVNFFIETPQKLYEGTPDEAASRTLLRETTHICQSQYATDQIAWLTRSFANQERPEQLRIFIRHETAPQGTPGRTLYGHEVIYEIEDGKCGRRIIREPILDDAREGTVVFRQ
ncbi:MAG: hypothetical protein AAGG69_08420, partial [Pseudomonadota bacterium]